MHVTTCLTFFDAGAGKHLVCNALTGEIAIMSDREVNLLDAIRAGDVSACPSSFMEALTRRCFVFTSEKEEREAFVALCESTWRDFCRKSSLHYTFIVNTHCNFACSYCFEAAYDAQPMTLSAAHVDAAFRFIDIQAARHRGASSDVEVFGGEPFLPGSRRVLDHLLRRVAERGIRASIQTNGYFLAKSLDFFLEHQDQIAQVQVTLDGPRAVHDRRRVPKSGRPTFDRIVVGICRLLDTGLPIRVNIRMNVDRENASDLEAMVHVYEENGWCKDERVTFVAAPVDNRCGNLRYTANLLRWDEMFERVFPLSTDTGGGPFDISVFKIVGYFRHYLQSVARREQPRFVPKVIYCEAAASRLYAFHPDGRVYPCPETVSIERLAIGTYYPRVHIDRRRISMWRKQTILQRPRCRDCTIATFCGGGCVLTALMHNGTMAEPECENAPDILEAYLDHLRCESE